MVGFNSRVCLVFSLGFLFSRGFKIPGKTGNIIAFPGIPGKKALSIFKQHYTQSTSLLTLKITKIRMIVVRIKLIYFYKINLNKL